MDSLALIDLIKFFFVVISPILISCVFLLNRLKQSEDTASQLLTKFDNKYSAVESDILKTSKQDVKSLLKRLGLTNSNEASVAKEEFSQFISLFNNFLIILFGLLLIGVLINSCIGLYFINKAGMVPTFIIYIVYAIFVFSIILIAILVYFIKRYYSAYTNCVSSIKKAQKDIDKLEEYSDIFIPKGPNI
jgi:hypothetical protein